MAISQRRTDSASQLESLLTATDHLAVTDRGELMIEGCGAPALLKRFGSPLFVISEATLRANYRRVLAAFQSEWPRPVNVLYATKANNTLAVRAVLTQEGAGGDCFGEGEIHASFQVDADPGRFTLNGSNKSPEALRRAAELGMVVNVDAPDEIPALEQLGAELARPVRAALRLKAIAPEFNEPETEYFGGSPGGLVGYVRRVKWGFTVDGAEPLVRSMIASPHLHLAGYHFHIGRATRDPRFQAAWADALGGAIVELHRRTGFSPGLVDMGGGWPRERDPESKSLDLNPVPIEEYARVACTGLREPLERAGLDLPEVWIEPGRYLVGNAVVLLATVGSIKHDLGMTWVNVDASTNDLPRIDTSGSAYHVLAASGMDRPCTERVTLVGPTCTDSIMGADRALPSLARGDAVAILDAGMYSESASTQFNSVGRPATVLVDGSDVEVVKERESTADVFAKHRIPARLRSRAGGEGGRAPTPQDGARAAS